MKKVAVVMIASLERRVPATCSAMPDGRQKASLAPSIQNLAACLATKPSNYI